ncbi:MAG: class I SAM-dependent methyltransferase [Gemmatimonadota bacterium]|nr:class I SAM-dependent methyltransferase [Gemmatimonadota bacterium]
MTALAVALASAAALAWQILLVRLFAIEQFHHFAYMAVGVAMLGYGASGTLVALLRPRRATWVASWFAGAAALTAVTLAAVPVAVGRLSVDPTQLAWQPSQWARLGLVYALLAVPFAAAALVTLLALVREPARTGRLYGASFVGAGLGAAAALAGLALAPPPRALAVPVLLAAAGAVCGAWTLANRRARLGVAVVGAAVAVVVLTRPVWRLDVLPYKGLPQALALPQAERVADQASPTGWLVAVRAPALRFAPGLSLAYRGPFPTQTGLFVDGDAIGAATTWDDSTVSLLDWLPAGLPYALGSRHRVLVLAAGGGMDLPAALAHGAHEVTAVELHGAVAALATPRWLEARAGVHVRWVTGDVRSAAAGMAATHDLVTLAPTGAPGHAAAGIHALDEDFDHTVDAYARFLRLLAPGGVFAVTTWLSLPPRGEVRAVLTVAAALRRLNPAAAARGMLVVRSWGTVTVLAKPEGFTAADLAAIEAWTAERWFDVDWRPGLERPATRFNVLEPPAVFEAAHAAATSAAAADAFADAYPLRVAPATDARPYPHHALGLGALARFIGPDRGALLPFAEWGVIALVATLAQCLVLAAVFVLLPVAVRGPPPGPGSFGVLLAYFGAIGLGYLAAELAAIQQLTLLLGHPVYAASAVLTVLLVSSGLGAAWSDRLDWRPTALAFTLAAGLTLVALALLGVLHAMQGFPLALRALGATLLLAPLGVAMGMPFPLGLRALAGGDRPRVAWAWAINGFASVVAAPLAALVGLELGSPRVFALAALAYGVAGLAVPAARRGPRATGTAIV